MNIAKFDRSYRNTPLLELSNYTKQQGAMQRYLQLEYFNPAEALKTELIRHD